MEIVILPDPEALAESAADRIAAALSEAIEERGRATLALSGGSTPAPAYRRLAASEAVDWGRVIVWQVDERCVPPDHPHSNWRMIDETLVAPSGVAGERMQGERPPDEGARDYERRLRASFGALPVFDVVVLGLGDDGHVASLFPDSPTRGERTRWVVPAVAPASSPVRERLTLTLPVLNAARLAVFLVSGASKAAAVDRALAGDPASPAALMRPAGRLVWLLDHDAASGAVRTGARDPLR